MGRRHLAGQHVLEPRPERVRRAEAIGKAGVDEAEDAALRLAAQRRHLGAPPDERQHPLPPPEMRDAPAPRLLRQQALVDAPERHEVIPLELLVEGLRVAGRQVVDAGRVSMRCSPQAAGTWPIPPRSAPGSIEPHRTSWPGGSGRLFGIESQSR